MALVWCCQAFSTGLFCCLPTRNRLGSLGVGGRLGLSAGTRRRSWCNIHPNCAESLPVSAGPHTSRYMQLPSSMVAVGNYRGRGHESVSCPDRLHRFHLDMPSQSTAVASAVFHNRCIGVLGASPCILPPRGPGGLVKTTGLRRASIIRGRSPG